MEPSEKQPLGVTHRVYIGNAARREKEDLRDSFVQFGDIRDVWIARNPPGFGFVTFYKAEDAEKAIREGNGMEIRGDRVTVELARSTVFSCLTVNYSGRSWFASLPLALLLEKPLQPLEKL